MCFGTTAGAEEAANTKEIEQQLRRDRERLENEVKLLLLGAGESGKSTIAKQMKIIHKAGFSDEEKASYKSIVHNNIVSAMRAIIIAAREMNISLDNPVLADKVLGADGTEYFTGKFTRQMATEIKCLWEDAGIQAAFSRQAEYQLIDSAQYYFSQIDRIGSPDYEPDEQDVLRSRAKTTGIVEIEFDVGNNHFRMVDVGGQRSERRKWVHCFEGVTAIIFCVALSEYDLKLQEDDQTNRMHESLKLFKEICSSPWFKDTSMVLFLNKKDLFEEKIQRVDLKVCFPDYKGGCNFGRATKFIERKFLEQNTDASRFIYPHITCATDTDNVTVVFNAVKDIVLKRHLQAAGVM